MTAPRPEDVTAPTPEPTCIGCGAPGVIGETCASCGLIVAAWSKPTPEKDSAAELFWRDLRLVGAVPYGGQTIDGPVRDVEAALTAALAEARKPATVEALGHEVGGVRREGHSRLVARDGQICIEKPAPEIKGGLTEEQAREMADRAHGGAHTMGFEACPTCDRIKAALLAVDAAARKDRKHNCEHVEFYEDGREDGLKDRENLVAALAYTQHVVTGTWADGYTIRVTGHQMDAIRAALSKATKR